MCVLVCVRADTLIELTDESDDDDERLAKLDKLAAGGAGGDSAAPGIAPSALPPTVQELISLLFDANTYTNAMMKFDIDVKKVRALVLCPFCPARLTECPLCVQMPLGKLSKDQVQRGFDVLVEIQEAMKQPASSRRSQQLSELSSRFFTVIPHSFGRQRPPVIDNAELLNQKLEMMNVLGDIEIAQNLASAKKKAGGAAKGKASAVPLEEHPLDKHYASIGASITPVDKVRAPLLDACAGT